MKPTPKKQRPKRKTPLRALLLFLSTTLPLFPAASEPEPDPISVDYALDVARENDLLRLTLHLQADETLSGFALYRNPEDGTPYENIPLEAFILDSDSIRSLPLIAFPESKLEETPLVIEVYIGAPGDAALSEARRIFALIEGSEADPARSRILKSEFARRIAAWDPSPAGALAASAIQPRRPQSFPTSSVVRGDDQPEASLASATGSIRLDKRKRGLAVIALPSNPADAETSP